MNDPQIYHFTKGDYGTSYSILAFSSEDALGYLKDYLMRLAQEEALENPHTDAYGGTYNNTYAKEAYEEWKDKTIADLTFEDEEYHYFNYHIEVFALGEVLETEKS